MNNLKKILISYLWKEDLKIQKKLNDLLKDNEFISFDIVTAEGIPKRWKSVKAKVNKISLIEKYLYIFKQKIYNKL